MTLSAVHKVTGARIVIGLDQDLRADYPEWDRLQCPVTGLPAFPVRSHSRLDDAIKVRSHFRVKSPAGEPTWPDDIIFDPEYGIERKGLRYFKGESWEHLEGKAFVASQFKNLVGADVKIEFEHVLKLPDARRRIADIALLYPSGFAEIHEIQLSPITVDEIEARTDDYASLGIPVQWWIGKSNTDHRDIREFLRLYQGGFYVLDFEERIPASVETLPNPKSGAIDF